MAKRGRLKDIRTVEVSVVDKPANKLSFVFFKREDGQDVDLLEKKKKIKIEIESNGTVGGTKITVNGDDLGKLRSFDFGFYSQDPKSPVTASYSKVTESVEGFSRTETYYLSKGEIVMDKEMLKALQEYFGTENIDFEKKIDGEEVQKAIELIAEHYKESFPEDLEKAVGVLVKCASGGYQVKEGKSLEKAGAKFSKDVVKKLHAIIAAVKALEGMLPKMSESTQKADDGGSEEVAELVKQVAELKEAIVKLDPGKKGKDDKAGSEITELTKTLEKIAKRVEAMEKTTDKSTRLEDDDDDKNTKLKKGAGKDGEVLWPSLATAEEQQE